MRKVYECAYFIAIFISLFLCLRPRDTFGEQMYFEQLCTYRGAAYVNATGQITAGTAQRLREFIGSADYESCDYAGQLRVSLSSQRGDAKAGIELGRFFHERRAIVEIGKRKRNTDCVFRAKLDEFDVNHCEPELEKRSCEDACSLAFLGGLDRKKVFADTLTVSQEVLDFEGVITQVRDDPNLQIAITEYLTEIGTDLSVTSLSKPYFPTILQLGKAGVLAESHIFDKPEFSGRLAIVRRPPGSSSNFNRLEIDCDGRSLAFEFQSDRPMRSDTILGVDVRASWTNEANVYEPITNREVANADYSSISFSNGTPTVRLNPDSIIWHAISRMPQKLEFEWIASGAVRFDLVAVILDEENARSLRSLALSCV